MATRRKKDPVESAILEGLQNPKRFAVDGQEVTAHDLGEVVAAAEYLERRQAARRNPFKMIHRTVGVPPGTV